MNLKYIFWPWGVIKDLKSDIAILDRSYEVAALTRDVDIAGVALIDIIDAAKAVTSPNGTTKKLRKIAETAKARLGLVFDDEEIARVRRSLAAEEAREAEYLARLREAEEASVDGMSTYLAPTAINLRRG